MDDLALEEYTLDSKDQEVNKAMHDVNRERNKARSKRGHLTRKLQEGMVELEAANKVSKVSRIQQEIIEQQAHDIFEYASNLTKLYETLSDADPDGHKYYDQRLDNISAATTKYRSAFISVQNKIGLKAQMQQNLQQNAAAAQPVIKPESIKPQMLDLEDPPSKLAQFKRQFRAYYEYSKLSTQPLSVQQAFFLSFLRTNILSLIDNKIQENLPVLPEGVQDSCFHVLDREFEIKNPLLRRRAAFFGTKQVDGQSESEYIADLLLKADLAQTNQMRPRDFTAYLLYQGLKKQSYKEEILKKQEDEIMNLDNLVTFVKQLEANTTTLKGASSSYAMQVKHKQSQGQNQGQSQGQKQSQNQNQQSAESPFKGIDFSKMTISEIKSLGICVYCGLHKHDFKKPCPNRDQMCPTCNSKGHLSRMCRTKTSSATNSVAMVPYSQCNNIVQGHSLFFPKEN